MLEFTPEEFSRMLDGEGDFIPYGLSDEQKCLIKLLGKLEFSNEKLGANTIGVRCFHCKGTGFPQGSNFPCPHCKGKGLT